MTTNNSEKTTYSDAGVDIDAGNALVERIKPHVKSTHRSGIMGSIGGFGGLFDLKAAGYDDPVLVAATDGVGTKLKLAQIAGRHDTIGIDLVAMCVNDLLAQGAEPLFFLDYYACGALNTDEASDVIAGIAAGCQASGCALIGGETAEMPGMYQQGDYDLAGFVVGAVSRDGMLPRSDAMQPGDALIGLASDGIHSNGYSLVRRLIEKTGLDYHGTAPWNNSTKIIDDLLTPTRLYVAPLLPLIKAGHIHAFAHITGGGITENLPRILPEYCHASIDCSRWQLPALFGWLQQAGNLDDADMLTTFNCGIGGIIAVSLDDAESVLSALSAAGETAYIIGELTQAQPGQSPVTYEGALQS